MSDWRVAANGRWLEILTSIGGIAPDYLVDSHGPCPRCGGTDRFRWDDPNGDGAGYCNQCGGKNGAGGAISGLDLLMSARNLTPQQAITAIEQHIGIEPEPLIKKKAKPYRRPEKPPIDARPPDRRGAIAQWCYRNANGEPLFWIQRVNLKDGKKVFVYRTWLDGKWHRPSKNDDFTCEWPAPRPLYGLDRLAQTPDATVLLTEGEKSADAAHQIVDDCIGVSWPNGSKAIRKIDWAALSGRRIIILRDNDNEGVTCTHGLIEILGPIAGEILVVDPPAGAASKWDIADPWPESESRTIGQWINAGIGAAEWKAASTEGDDDDGIDDCSPPADGGAAEKRERLDKIPIVCLGFNGDDYFYQSGDSGQVTRITKQAHSSSTSLVGLADLGIWEQTYPRYNGEGEIIGVSWKEAVNDLFRRQHRVGIFDPTRIRGVGAWIDDGRHVFHLGDRLLIDDKKYSVFSPPVSRYLYQRLTRRVGPADAPPLTVTEGQAILAMSERFHWEEPISGTLLAGWIALAPICGAIDWRPHIWLQAVAGSGKTTVLNRYVSPLLSDLKLKVLGCTTEAGIRQRLKCDAIPVIFDESESNLKRDAERIQSVLALARIASSDGDSVALKGSAGGDSMQYTIRSMFLLSSIATALRQGADESRFCVLTLRIPDDLSAEEKDRQWRQLDADLIDGITEEHGHRLAARMIRMVPVVRAATKTFARAAALELGSARSGDQIGALLAGAWALWNDAAPSEVQAVDLIRNADWGTQRIQAEESGGDQRRCLDTILQHRLRVEVEHGTLSRTVSELIELACGVGNPLEPISPPAAEAELGRNGIRVYEDRLLISNTARGVAAMLRDTPWADQGWGNLLGSLPGAVKNRPTRFKGIAKMSRCVSLPRSQFQPGEWAD